MRSPGHGILLDLFGSLAHSRYALKRLPESCHYDLPLRKRPSSFFLGGGGGGAGAGAGAGAGDEDEKEIVKEKTEEEKEKEEEFKEAKTENEEEEEEKKKRMMDEGFDEEDDTEKNTGAQIIGKIEEEASQNEGKAEGVMDSMQDKEQNDLEAEEEDEGVPPAELSDDAARMEAGEELNKEQRDKNRLKEFVDRFRAGQEGHGINTPSAEGPKKPARAPLRVKLVKNYKKSAQDLALEDAMKNPVVEEPLDADFDAGGAKLPPPKSPALLPPPSQNTRFREAGADPDAIKEADEEKPEPSALVPWSEDGAAPACNPEKVANCRVQADVIRNLLQGKCADELDTFDQEVVLLQRGVGKDGSANCANAAAIKKVHSLGMAINSCAINAYGWADHVTKEDRNTLELGIDDLKECLNSTIKDAPPPAPPPPPPPPMSFLATSCMHLDEAGRRVYDPPDFEEDDDFRIDLPGEKFPVTEDSEEPLSASEPSSEPLWAPVTTSSFILGGKEERLDEAGRVIDDSFSNDNDTHDTTDANDSEEPTQSGDGGTGDAPPAEKPIKDPYEVETLANVERKAKKDNPLWVKPFMPAVYAIPEIVPKLDGSEDSSVAASLPGGSDSGFRRKTRPAGLLEILPAPPLTAPRVQLRRLPEQRPVNGSAWQLLGYGRMSAARLDFL